MRPCPPCANKHIRSLLSASFRMRSQVTVSFEFKSSRKFLTSCLYLQTLIFVLKTCLSSGKFMLVDVQRSTLILHYPLIHEACNSEEVIVACCFFKFGRKN